MGNSYDGEDEGIEAMKYIPAVARRYINHHLGNSLTSLSACLATEDIEGCKEAVDHIIDDLKGVGFFQLSEKEKTHINIKTDPFISPEILKKFIEEDLIPGIESRIERDVVIDINPNYSNLETNDIRLEPLEEMKESMKKQTQGDVKIIEKAD